MKTPEISNNLDLIDILSEPVEVKDTQQYEFNLFDEPNSENAKINPNDFELPSSDDMPHQTTDPSQITKKPPRLSESEYEEQAEMSIALFDGLQVITLPWLYQKSMFTRKELLQIKKLKEKKKFPEVELTEEDLKLEEKYHTYKELADAVPLNEKEIEMIKGPLAKVFSKYNIQIGPEFILLSALSYISIPRYLPLFSKLEKYDI